MPAAYPINSYQPIVPFDGPPTDQSIGMLGQVGVDVNSGSYYQKIGGKWYTFGQGPTSPVLTTLTGVPGTDSSPADGTTKNSVTFTAQDQNGDPMEVILMVTMAEGASAVLDQTSLQTSLSNGQATVTLSDTVAEAVSITATENTSGKIASATSTFVAVPGSKKA